MINSLRRKFIILSISTITFVILSVFITINILNFNDISNRSDQIIYRVKDDKELFLNLVANTDQSKEPSDKFLYDKFFVAEVSNDNKILYIVNKDSRKTTEELTTVVEKAIQLNKDMEYVDYYKFCYVTIEGHKFLLFIDREQDFIIGQNFLENSILVGFLIVILSSLILIGVSSRIVKPFEENYKKQKQFITDASHELKTPLTIISSNADVLEMQAGNSKWLSNIHNQIDRLTYLINSLVAFSRVEEKNTLEKTKFSLTNLLQSRIEDFDELANFKGKKLVVNAEKEVYYIGDANTIMQVIDILLDNAIKYADDDSEINVELKNNKKNVELRVTNKAQDIKKGELNEVFDRFYRLDESRNSTIKGYGIGLSLANLIVEKHKSIANAYSPEDGIFVISIKFM